MGHKMTGEQPTTSAILLDNYRRMLSSPDSAFIGFVDCRGHFVCVRCTAQLAVRGFPIAGPTFAVRNPSDTIRDTVCVVCELKA